MPSPINITRIYILNVNINESFSFSSDHVYMFDFAHVFIFNDFWQSGRRGDKGRLGSSWGVTKTVIK